MSPRSEEFLNEARARLEAARALIERELLGAAVSEAYYAMLYAARAALSESERNAKTHGGTWGLFHGEFVAGGRFDADLYREASAAQETRVGVDYGAVQVEREEAARLVDVAQRFLEAVSSLIDS